MEFRQLKTFVTAARLESFSKTAELLGYSQSAVTVQIRLLEEELDTRLFDRLGRKIALTAQGQRFLEQSQLILQDINQAKESVREETDLKNPLHIGTLESLCFAKLPPVLGYFRANHPRVPIKVTTAPPGKLYEMLEQNQLDLIYLLDRARYNKNWIKAMDRRKSIVFVTSPCYWGDRPKSICLKDMIGEPFFLTEKNENYRKELDSFLETQELELIPSVEISNTDFIIKMLKENGGISYLPGFAVEESIGRGELIRLDVRDLDVIMYQQIFYHRCKWKTQEMDVFISRLGGVSEDKTWGGDIYGDPVKTGQ